jgi:DNA-binding CsgD family transcriptional regulator
MFDATTVVTVDRLLGSGLAHTAGGRTRPARPGGVGGAKTANVSLSHLRHRIVLGNSRRTDVTHGTRRDDGVETPPCGLILVVECDPESTGTPGIATLATCSAAKRLGFTTHAIPLPSGDTPPVTIEGVPIDLVVLLVGSEPTGQPTPWMSSTWCLPAQLARSYGVAGIDVIAVSVGAGVGALTNCIVNGATVLFDFNELPAHLVSRSQRAPADGRGSWEPLVHRVPPQLDALMRLTSSERRVLFYLTTGTSPADIALELVVSLATVRSHIRSILRKLGVRSQLAAVALANGSGLLHEGGGLDTTDSVTLRLAGPEDARSA